jgi:hypothetical protein
MRDDLRVDDPTIENALDGDGFALGNRIGILAPGAEIDQRAAAAVVEDEFVAEYLGDVAPHGSRASVLQFVDRARLKQHDALRLPTLRKFYPAGAGGRAYDEHGQSYPTE